MNKGRLFVISGASGAGKNTVINKAMELRPELFYSVSATTRQPRDGEQNGVHYHFVTHERFHKMIANGELLEHAQYVDNYYGTPLAPILEKTEAGIDVVMDIDVQGAMQVKRAMPGSVLVFVMPPRFSDLETRIRNRSSNSEADIAKRVKTAKAEYACASKYDYIVINDTPENAAAELLTIMRAERYRAENRLAYASTDR